MERRGRPDADVAARATQEPVRDPDRDRADVGSGERVGAGEAAEQGPGAAVRRTERRRALEELALELDEPREVEKERIVADTGERLAADGGGRDPVRSLVGRGRADADRSGSRSGR